MKLSEAELKCLTGNHKLWLFDNRKKILPPKPAILKLWDSPETFIIHIFEDETEYRQIDHLRWSVRTNGPVGELKMPINSKVWLAKRD